MFSCSNRNMSSAEHTPSTAPVTPTREARRVATPRPRARDDGQSRSTNALPGRYLLVEDGAERRLLPLTAETTSIGRGMSSDVTLNDHTVSRRHALIVLRGAGARVLDDRSTNGTWVNGPPGHGTPNLNRRRRDRPRGASW